jgi:hypothetical protein
MRLILLIFVVSLAACQSLYSPPYSKGGQPNFDSAYFEVPVDSKLTLNRDVTIPPHKKNVFFQFGKALPFQDVNQYREYCALTVFAKKKVPQTIKPDTFHVSKVSRQYLFSLAQANVDVAQVLNGDDGDTWQVLATVMEIQSDKQQDVINLLCAAWGLPQDISRVTVNGIRAALGDIATLQLAQPGDAVPMRRSPRRTQGWGY